MSVRQNFAVYAGEEEKRPVYTILVNKAGRAMQVMNGQDERVALLERSVKPLLLNAALGVGSEFMIDVAAGVDWTAILAIVIGLHQVAKDVFKDELNNFLVQSLQDAVMGDEENEAEQAIEGDDGENDDGDDYGGDGGADADEEGGGDADADADEDHGGDAGADDDSGDEEGGIGGRIISLIGEFFQ